MSFPTLFLKILIISAITSAFVSGGILDSYAIDELKKVNRVDEYGKFRLWTAISWGLEIVSWGLSRICTAFLQYSIPLVGFQFVNLVLTAYFIPNRTADEAVAIVEGKTSPKLKDLFFAMTRGRVLILLLLVGVFGAGFGVVDRLLFVYLIDSFNATKLCVDYCWHDSFV